MEIVFAEALSCKFKATPPKKKQLSLTKREETQG